MAQYLLNHMSQRMKRITYRPLNSQSPRILSLLGLWEAIKTRRTVLYTLVVCQNCSRSVVVEADFICPWCRGKAKVRRPPSTMHAKSDSRPTDTYPCVDLGLLGDLGHISVGTTA